MSNYQVIYCGSVYSNHKDLKSAICDFKHLVRKFGINDVDLIDVGDDIKTIRLIITKEEKNG